MEPTGTDDVTGNPTYTIPEHKRDDGKFCRWSHGATNRADGWCPDRCQSIAPKPDDKGSCVYSPRHAMIGVPAVTVIDCGQVVGQVPACQKCADFYARQTR